jgi:hypothetical protein
VQFYSLVTFGHAIHHPVFLAKGQMNANWTLQTLKCDGGMHWLNFSSATDEWWQNKIKKNAWLFGHG